MWEQDLYKKVAWIAQKDAPDVFRGRKVTLRDFEFTVYIEVLQYKLMLPSRYRIDFSNKTEKENLAKILEAHRNYVIKQYFCDCLPTSRSIRNLTFEEYYFFSLCEYLNEKLANHSHDLYCFEEKISETIFRCELNELGRLYYKLYLIVRVYAEGNKYILKVLTAFDKEKKDDIMKELDENKVEFMDAYRP